MLILLPPSEGKVPPTFGPPLDLDALSLPALTDARRIALAALRATSARPDALARLHAPAGAADAVAANLVLERGPTAPASRVYAGVLFEALDVAGLAPDAAARAGASVLVFSALFGVVGLDDRIPAYRASASSRIDDLGIAGTWWRSRLAGVLDPLAADTPLVVDARSAGYASFWRPARSLAVTVVTDAGGRRRPVSHWAKQARGYVARALLEADPGPATPDEAVDAVNAWFAARRLTTATGRELRLTATLDPDRRALEVLTR